MKSRGTRQTLLIKPSHALRLEGPAKAGQHEQREKTLRVECFVCLCLSVRACVCLSTHPNPDDARNENDHVHPEEHGADDVLEGQNNEDHHEACRADDEAEDVGREVAWS